MTTPEDLRVFKLIAEHQTWQDKVIRKIQIVLWFILGTIIAHFVEHCSR